RLARWRESRLSRLSMVAVEPNRPADALEEGAVVFYPKTPFALPGEDEFDLVRRELPATLKAKNVSFYPDAGRLTGRSGDEALKARVRAVLERRSATVIEFLRRAMPSFVEGMRVGTSSFRPLQEHGRNLKSHASNELVHVDAGAYGATLGDRILRVFTNVHPSAPRVWCTRGTFKSLFERYGEAAGVRAGSIAE